MRTRDKVLAGVFYAVGAFFLLVGLGGLLIVRDLGGISFVAIGALGIFAASRLSEAQYRPSVARAALPDWEDESDRLLTLDEVAERLGVERGWVLNLVARDAIPYVQFGPGRSVYSIGFNADEIERWIDEEEQHAAR